MNLTQIKIIVKELFKVDLTEGQAKIVWAIAFAPNKRVLILCPTRYGKSFCVSIGMLLYLLKNEKKNVNLIAPINDQTTIIRSYLADHILQCPELSENLDLEATGIEKLKKEVSKKRWTFKDGSQIRTFSAEGKGERLMGWGGDLIVEDESYMIDEEVFRTRISRMLENPDSKLVMIGNPWHRDGHSYHYYQDPNTLIIEIDEEQAIREGRLSREHVKEQQQLLTEMEYAVLYRARHPEESEDQLIRLSWIQQAISVKAELPPEKSRVVIGVDVAEMGRDLSVVTVARELNGIYQLLHVESWGKTDLMPTVGRISEIASKFEAKLIMVDAIGVGSGVYSRLKELKDGHHIKQEIIGIKVGMSPSERFKNRFLNLKAENYWKLRELFEQNRISIPKHKELISQLTKIKYELTSSAKIKIIDPEDKSPDFADALMILVSEPIQGGITYLPYIGR